MRAWLLPWLPALARTFGIRAPDIGLYSVAELNEYVEDLLREAEQIRNAKRG